MDALMKKLTIPTAEPFFFPGEKSTGVLLTHGFTGAPKEMRWMGEYLNREHGYPCLGVRLAGHATRPEDMTVDIAHLGDVRLGPTAP